VFGKEDTKTYSVAITYATRVEQWTYTRSGSNADIGGIGGFKISAGSGVFMFTGNVFV